MFLYTNPLSDEQPAKHFSHSEGCFQVSTQGSCLSLKFPLRDMELIFIHSDPYHINSGFFTYNGPYHIHNGIFTYQQSLPQFSSRPQLVSVAFSESLENVEIQRCQGILPQYGFQPHPESTACPEVLWDFLIMGNLHKIFSLPDHLSTPYSASQLPAAFHSLGFNKLTIL